MFPLHLYEVDLQEFFQIAHWAGRIFWTWQYKKVSQSILKYISISRRCNLVREYEFIEDTEHLVLYHRTLVILREIGLSPHLYAYYREGNPPPCQKKYPFFHVQTIRLQINHLPAGRFFFPSIKVKTQKGSNPRHAQIPIQDRDSQFKMSIFLIH